MHHGRLYYLDALRSFCMLYGVFVHTGAFLGADGIDLIGQVSKYFRMDTFFLVSGFLVALVAARTSVPQVLRKRSVALLVPLVSMVVLFNPLTNWLIHLRHAGPMPLSVFLFEGGWRSPAGAEASWLLHLWFLISLWVYVMLFPLLAAIVRFGAVQRGLAALGRLPGEVLILGVALGIAAAGVALRVVSNGLVEPLLGGTPFEWVALATLLHLPYFTLGVLLHASRPFFERMHRVSLLTIGLGLLLVFLEGRLGAGLSRGAGVILDIVARAILTTGLVAGLLALSRRLVSDDSRIVALLINSIYTVYLFHYMVIYALGLLLLGFVPAGPVYYLILTPVVILLLLLFHRHVIARVPLLRFLFNGKPMRAPVRVARAG